MMAKKKVNSGQKRQPGALAVQAEQHVPVPSVGQPPSDTSERRDEDTKNVPGEEVVAATDELFKQPNPPIEAKVAENPQPLLSSSEGEGPNPEDDVSRPSPFRDYVRELQQEFEEQEEEGKV
jgi:hypothetical protein